MLRLFVPAPTRLARTLATHASSPAQSSRLSWSKQQIQDLYDSPLMDLVFRAASVHRQHHDPSKIQLCTLMNIKTGGCTEDCSYCSQSSRYSTPTKASRLVDIEPVLEAARKAKENGSTRFCMGAAWRDLAGRKRGFEKILEMVREVRAMDMEVCTTLGMLSPDQARQLKEAGLTAYNHNLDTSREFYPQVITTRSYDERLDTISAVRDAGISVCSGGILGLGESDADRVGLIWEVSNMPEHPESFPVNALVPIEGTPLENNEPVKYHVLLRDNRNGPHRPPEHHYPTGRWPKHPGRIRAGYMLTTPCSPWDEDKAMMSRWGLTGMNSFEQQEQLEASKATRPEENVAQAA
ncbi:Product biotin synthase [Mycena chlorophos]|uniref:Product biotin synthase n=1 Tax=Mycena chlorophos TaxID=658473 RepID=A0A8H6T432_MYCCL|nr:Product biotin synthase [Mycena chlorophos]